jgi:hypothetical protein
MKIDPTINVTTMVIAAALMALAMAVFRMWMRERDYERHLRIKQEQREEERERKRLELEEQRISNEESARYQASNLEEEKLVASKSGAGSGGYIVVDIPESERPLFHDLLKGFEDYAKLKGYHLAFSIDSTLEDRIAFKFTVKDDGIVVGAERVRKDFKEYMAEVHKGNLDNIDNLPVIVSIEEHNFLVALLKNRITFLQHNYQLEKNAVRYYETLLLNARSFPALPAPSIIIQNTGASMDSRNYSATNSQRLIQGEGNTYTDSSVNIGESLKEKQERVAALEMENVREELVEAKDPDQSTMKKYLQSAKNIMGTATLGYEVTEAAKKLFDLFGLS